MENNRESRHKTTHIRLTGLQRKCQGLIVEQVWSLHQMMLEKLDIRMRKNEFGIVYLHHTKQTQSRLKTSP